MARRLVFITAGAFSRQIDGKMTTERRQIDYLFGKTHAKQLRAMMLEFNKMHAAEWMGTLLTDEQASCCYMADEAAAEGEAAPRLKRRVAWADTVEAGHGKAKRPSAEVEHFTASERSRLWTQDWEKKAARKECALQEAKRGRDPAYAAQHREAKRLRQLRAKGPKKETTSIDQPGTVQLDGAVLERAAGLARERAQQLTAELAAVAD